MYYISNEGKKAVCDQARMRPFGAAQGSHAGQQEVTKKGTRMAAGPLGHIEPTERLRPRVTLFVFLPHVGVGQVRIDLGSRDAGVPKQFLDVAQRCAVLQQVGSKAVA